MSSLALKGTIAAPLIGFLTKLGPPPATAVPILTSITGFIAVIWTFHFWHDVSQRRLNARMRLCLLVFCVALLASGILFGLYTIRPGSGRDLVVCGYSLRPDILPLMTAGYTSEQALRDAEYDASQVWTETSIVVVRLALTASWLIAFVSISMFVSTFIILQRRPHATLTKARVR